MSGLIRWKIVTHAFIDGFSQFVTGIQAGNNNCAETVYKLFLDLVDVHGLPSYIHGDHGIENLLVTAHIEAVKGWHEDLTFGVSKITLFFFLLLHVDLMCCNRSVHNFQIEHLWCDVTTGFGFK